MTSPVFILGPTASGKSALAMELAQRLSLGIASVDAFQVYRHMDIGTAKAPRQWQSQVPHALLDLVEPDQPFSSGSYLEAAAALCNQSNATSWLWVGGTGLYYRALRRGMSPAPASNPATVASLETLELSELQRRITACDPAWAAQADLNNPRRIIRALAVQQDTGIPLSTWQQQNSPPLIPDATTIFLLPSPDLLRERIHRRITAMWQEGWPEEVRTLLQIPGWEDSTASRAIGYREMVRHLRGELDPVQTHQLICQATWRYTRRQLTWFRSEDNLTYVEFDTTQPDAGHILTLLEKAAARHAST